MPEAEAEPELYKETVVEESMNVNVSFSLDDGAIGALLKTLSPARLGPYLDVADGDERGALKLYTWNTAISAAFYGPLQWLEVALRNAMDSELSKMFGQEWYDSSACRLNAMAQRKIAEAKAELQRGKYPQDPPHMVAALSFGFWVSLLSRGDNYEQTLWRPGLHRAFASRLKRADAHSKLDYLRKFRNRIAHHEPIFRRRLEEDYRSLLTVAEWICPKMCEWISHRSRVQQLLASPRHEALVSF